jgi:hypothetical protein
VVAAVKLVQAEKRERRDKKREVINWAQLPMTMIQGQTNKERLKL